MTAMVREQERIANNLANANTVGYKHDRTFTSTLEEYIDVEGAPQSDRTTEQWASLQQGSFEATGNPLDLAIESDGFFVLSDEAGGAVRYTRAGRFMLDGQGVMRDANGYLVGGADGPIRIPRDAATIDIQADGTIRADDEPVGQVRVVRFDNPEALERLDGAAFSADNLESRPVDDPALRQGFLETSNVNPLTEMSQMITHFRLFESQQKALQTHDQILGHVTRELGKF